MERQEIASVFAFLASEEAPFFTGWTPIIDGGLSMLAYTSLRILEKSCTR